VCSWRCPTFARAVDLAICRCASVMKWYSVTDLPWHDQASGKACVGARRGVYEAPRGSRKNKTQTSVSVCDDVATHRHTPKLWLALQCQTDPFCQCAGHAPDLQRRRRRRPRQQQPRQRRHWSRRGLRESRGCAGPSCWLHRPALWAGRYFMFVVATLTCVCQWIPGAVALLAGPRPGTC
jgi:hypothetical protein